MAHFDAVLPGRVTRVIYEDLVADTEGEVRRLLDVLGLPFDPACLRFFENRRAVATPSSEQVRRPIFADGVDQLAQLRALAGPAEGGAGAGAGRLSRRRRSRTARPRAPGSAATGAARRHRRASGQGPGGSGPPGPAARWACARCAGWRSRRRPPWRAIIRPRKATMAPARLRSRRPAARSAPRAAERQHAPIDFGHRHAGGVAARGLGQLGEGIGQRVHLEALRKQLSATSRGSRRANSTFAAGNSLATSGR